MAGESSSGPSASSSRLDTVFQNVKRVFSLKKKQKAKRAEILAEPLPEVPPAPPPPPAPAAAAAAAVAAVPEKAIVPEKSKTPVSRRPRAPPGPPPPVLSPVERATELFKKHGIEITPGSLPRADTSRGERVYKEIRMRVHRTCHRCSTSYGADKTCLTCGHRRCKQCPRFPQKKVSKGKEKVGEKREVKPIRRRKVEPVLTIPSRTGGQDRVRKKIRQRVHRTCHRCDTDFGAEKVCSNCKHNRCKKCPRDPYKKNKPRGYYDARDDSDSEASLPRDLRPRRTYKPIKMRVHWTCSKCSATFQGTKSCEGCGALREDTGIRDPPKRVRNPNAAIPSESYMEHLEERLMATSIA